MLICSFQYVKSLGAEAAFDYNDQDCSKKINEHTSDNVKLTLDCISEGDSTKICTAATSSSGGKIASLLPLQDQDLRADVEYSVCCYRACSILVFRRISVLTCMLTACQWVHRYR